MKYRLFILKSYMSSFISRQKIHNIKNILFEWQLKYVSIWCWWNRGFAENLFHFIQNFFSFWQNILCHFKHLKALYVFLRSLYWRLKKIYLYSRVRNRRTPLNKRSPLENLSKRIIVAPFLPYTMKSGIRL